MDIITTILWHVVHTPAVTATVMAGVTWVLHKVGILGDGPERMYIAVAAQVGLEHPTATWTQFVGYYFDELARRKMAEPSGRQFMAVRRAWEMMEGEKKTPPIVARALTNGMESKIRKQEDALKRARKDK